VILVLNKTIEKTTKVNEAELDAGGQNGYADDSGMDNLFK
jgi:hypothetical protein